MHHDSPEHQTMRTADLLLPEYDSEMAIARTVLTEQKVPQMYGPTADER